MCDSGQEIIKTAIDEFRTQISAQDARAFESTSLPDVWDVARRIEREQKERTRLQNMRRIEPVLRLLDSYAAVMDTFCRDPSVMAFTWVCIISLKTHGPSKTDYLAS
jgi:hypothetical protein